MTTRKEVHKMATTINRKGKTMSLDDAVKRARIRLLCGNSNPKSTQELEKCHAELREYITMKKIQKLFDAGVEYR